jgi:perosamine synthetase
MTLNSGWISSIGSYLACFEEGFAHFCEVKHAITTNRYRGDSLGVGCSGHWSWRRSDCPDSHLYCGCNAVHYCGATPVLVDCEEETLNIDVRAIERKITGRTRAIIPVHLYGHPADLDPILELSKKHNLHVVEDAAEAHGAKYKGRSVGSIGTCAAFSFYGNKIVATGEGGMVTTNDDELAAKLRLFRGQGMEPDRRYWHSVIGYNYRMTNIAAALGCAQLKRVNEAVERRRQLASWYSSRLSQIPGLVLPVQKEYTERVYWMYTVLLSKCSADARDAVREILAGRGVETRPVFYPMHLLPPYEEDWTHYPKATECAARGMTLPTHEFLTEEDVAYICEQLEIAFQSVGLSLRAVA